MLLLLSALTEVSQNLRVSSSFGSAGCSGLLQKSVSLKELVPEGSNCPSLRLKQVKKELKAEFSVHEGQLNDPGLALAMLLKLFS